MALPAPDPIATFPPSAFAWKPGLNNYVNVTTGRIVSHKKVLNALENTVSAAKLNMVNASQALRSGTISVAEWQTIMAGNIKAGNLAAYTLAKGGWAQMTPSDYGRVGAEVKKQYGYLNNFAGEIASGKWPLDGRLDMRAGLYGESASTFYKNARRRIIADANEITEERRVLGIADHCQDAGGLEGCPTLANKGWQPVGTLPPIGMTPCGRNCKCGFESRTADGKVLE